MFPKELFKNKFRIKSTRLPHWDYSHPGYYYVTICVKDFICCLGQVKDGEVILSPRGKIIKQCWLDLLKHYQCELDEYIIMPNHVHGIVVIYDNKIGNYNVETGLKPVSTTKNIIGQQSLSEIIRGFKTFSAKRINQLQDTPGRPFWQPRFYDHVIRYDQDLDRIREYIRNNPLRWEYDRNRGIIIK